MYSVIIPVKRFSLAKQRLADCLTSEQRVLLVKAMLNDVLQQLNHCSEVAEVVLLTAALQPSDVTHYPNVAVHCDDHTEIDLNVALSSCLAARAFDRAGVVVLHGDLPALSATDVSALCQHHQQHNHSGMTLVSDATGEGTNALLFPSRSAVSFTFGEHSRVAHRRGSVQAGLSYDEWSSPALALDIDRCDDLRHFQQLCIEQPWLQQRSTFKLLEKFQWAATIAHPEQRAVCHG